MAVALDYQLYDALDRAAQLVEAGWTAGAYARNKAGEACDLGVRGKRPRRVDLFWALTLAATEYGLLPADLHHLVRQRLPEPYRSDDDFGLERWNDQPYRTRGEVLMLIRNAREALRG